MRSRIAYSLAAGCLLLTLASLALWAVSLWRGGQVSYRSTAAGTTTAHLASLEWGIVGYAHESAPSTDAWVPEGWYAFLLPSNGPRCEHWADWWIDREDPSLPAGWRTTHVALAGFGVGRSKAPGATAIGVHIPLWFTAAVPAFFAYRLFRHARRVPTAGLCPRCGYDVRVQHAGAAAPRCPECGTALPAPPPHDATA